MAEVLEFYTQKVTDDPEQREHWQRCRLEAATRLAKYQSPQLQAIAVQQETPETELARMSDEELFKALQAQGAAHGFTIERIRPQLTLVDGSKQDEGA
jgi:phosphoribosylanthranilate isomerase